MSQKIFFKKSNVTFSPTFRGAGIPPIWQVKTDSRKYLQILFNRGIIMF